MLLLGHIILKETPIYLVICLVTYNFNRWGFSVQPILRVFNTLKHIHTNTSTHLSATKIKMTLFLYVSRQKKKLVFNSFQKPFKTINPQKYHANDTQNTRLQLKILRIKLNKIRKLKGVKNALYLFNNSHKY